MEELITLCDETVGNVMKLENQVNLEFRVSETHASIFVLLLLHIITLPYNLNKIIKQLFKAKIEEICLKHDKDNAPTKSKSRVKRLGTIMDEEGGEAL